MKNTIRIVLTGLIVALLPPSPAHAACRAKVTRVKDGWRLCDRPEIMRHGAAPSRVLARGGNVVVEFAGAALYYFAVDVPHYFQRLALERGERPVRYAFGTSTVYAGLPGRGIVRLFGAPIDVDPKGGPSTLRGSGGTVRWRSHGALRRISAWSGYDLRARGCHAPRYAVGVRRSGTALTYELRQGTRKFSGFIFGCLDAGRTFKLGATEPVNPTHTLGFHGRFVLVSYPSTVPVSESLTAFDLRTGAVTAGMPNNPGPVHRALLSPSGAIAAVRGDGEVITVRDYTVATLDRGPEVDSGSLALDGTTLTWRHGAETRSADLP
jgi:hypothetical protein